MSPLTTEFLPQGHVTNKCEQIIRHQHCRVFKKVTILLLLPANEVWGKEMFSQMFVHRGGCVVKGGVIAPPPPGLRGRHQS